MTIERADQAPFQETRRSRKARYAKKEGRILGRFVKVPLSLLLPEYGSEVVAVFKAGAATYVIAEHDGRMLLSREAAGCHVRQCEIVGAFEPGIGRLESVKQLRARIDKLGGGYNRILYAIPPEAIAR